MQEKFYCVGCKSHYELKPTGLERKPSKGGSFRYAMKSVCPKGHRTSKICNEDDFADYADDLELCPKCGSESWYEEPTDHAYCYDCSCSDCGHTEWKEVDGPDYDDYDDPRYEAEGMTVGVNLEALAPTPAESESGESLVPADSLLPVGSGHIIGSQSVSHNYTPFHAEYKHECITCAEGMDELVAKGQTWSCECCGLLVGTTGKHEGCGINDEGVVMCNLCYSGQCDCESFDAENQDMMCCGDYMEFHDDYFYCPVCETTIETNEFDAEEFIAHRELKDHLLSIMPDKIYGVKALDDGDFEMRVADRYMDDVIEAVSEYQISESDSDSFFLGQSKSTVAAVAAVVALGFAFWQNRKR